MTRAFEIVLLLNLTGLFSFVAIQVGIPIAAMSAGILIFLLFYLAVNYRHAWWFLQKKSVLAWLVFAFIWPALTVVYAEVPDFRANAVNFYLIALMLSTAIWLSKVGFHGARKVVVAAAIITVVGLVLSLVRNDYFQAVAEAANARYSYLGRAFGFFLQPNMAAENLSFMYALLMPLVSSKSRTMMYVVTALFVSALLITGSRGGMIVGLSMVTYVHILSSSAETGRFRSIRQKTAAVLVIGVALLLANQVATLVGESPSSSDTQAKSSLTDRIGGMSSLDIEGGGLGRTAALRYTALVEHGQGITERPLFGYGIASSNNFSSSGRLAHASHNQYVQVAYDMGIPALILYLVLLYQLWQLARTRTFSHAFGCNPAMILFLAVSLSGLFSNTVLMSRVYFAVLGAVLAMRYVPVHLTNMRSSPR